MYLTRFAHYVIIKYKEILGEEKLMRNEAKNYFYCYDPKMSKHLKNCGLDYITMAKNRYDGSLFTLWYKSEEFETAITSYSKK